MADQVEDLTGCIELYHGSFLNFSDPDPTVITPDDVAHGLAHVCRYTGHCSRFYSVAEHALLVAWRLMKQGYGWDVCWAGLHHDDAEAFVGDVNRPLKDLLPEYRTIERRIWETVNEALDLRIDGRHDEIVKEADNWALSAEAYYLLPSKGAAWFTAGLYDPDRDEFPTDPLGSDPATAEAAWLLAHEWLGLAVRN